MNNKDAYMMLKNIQNSKNVKCTTAQLKVISHRYKTSLEEGWIQILNGELVIYKLILVNHRYIVLLIITQSLRRSVFSHFHIGPSGEHMKGYKTLYIMWLQFFYYKLRVYFTKLVTGCSHCGSYNFWKTRKQ